MREIQESTGRYSRDSGYEDEDEDNYNEEDEDEGEDDEEDDEEKGGLNTNLRRVMTIVSLAIGAVAICILIYLVASAAGIVGGLGNNNGEQTQQEETENDTETVTVPSLTNMTEDVAQTTLNDMKLGFRKGGEEASDTVPEGQVCRQDPAAGTKVEINTTIVYYISTGPAEEENVTIPTGLIGLTLSEVQSQLQSLGLNPTIEQAESSDVAVGNVISLSPGEGSVVPAGSSVTITVSIGEGDTNMTTVPQRKRICGRDGYGDRKKRRTDPKCGIRLYV